MRVLDVGCGSGQSSFLAAGIVGTSGWVTGFEAEHGAVREARARADRESLPNLEFVESEFALLGSAPFEMIMGRCYLVTMAEPAVEIRRLARLVTARGIIAFLEPELDFGVGVSRELCWESWHRNAATGMSRAFLEAGLGWPNVRAYQTPGGVPLVGAWARVA
jgi:ubiquinone/menaquinone biosynthesis C-methylase UbiE